MTAKIPAHSPNPASLLPDPATRQQWRIWFVLVVFALLALLIIVRLFQYQVIAWVDFDRASMGQLTGSSEMVISRGVVVDRDGEILAADRFLYQIVAAPAEIPEAKWPGLALQLEQSAGIPATETLAKFHTNSTSTYVVLADGLDLVAGGIVLDAQAQQIQDEVEDGYLSYLSILPLPRRYYPQQQLASQVLGFVDMNRDGVYGLEGYYDPFLRANGVGLPKGARQKSGILSPEVARFVPSTTGKDLVLSIDRSIQHMVEEELHAGLEVYRALQGTIIVMDPHTGAILAMDSQPAYNPNTYSEYPVRNYLNPAISSSYEPGSIFKIITYAAALDTGTITPRTLYTDTGNIAVGGRIIQNSSRQAAGQVSTTEALALSLNVVTAQVAVDMGAKAFYDYLQRFGFGEVTGIDLSGEERGIFKSPGSEQWSMSDLGANSFGQGLAVTPIQMINAAAAIANGGNLLRPFIVQYRVQGEQVMETRPTVVQRIMTAETAATMTQMMIDTVDLGNKRARVPGYVVAGKSGTAQIPTAEGYTEDETIVSFVGFAPADDPKFVILIKMDRPDPTISPWASNTAAPMFSRVARRLLEYLNVPPTAVQNPESENPDKLESHQ